MLPLVTPVALPQRQSLPYLKKETKQLTFVNSISSSSAKQCKSFGGEPSRERIRISATHTCVRNLMRFVGKRAAECYCLVPSAPHSETKLDDQGPLVVHAIFTRAHHHLKENAPQSASPPVNARTGCCLARLGQRRQRYFGKPLACVCTRSAFPQDKHLSFRARRGNKRAISKTKPAHCRGQRVR